MTTTRTRLGALISAGVLTFGLTACAAEEGSGDEATTPAESAAEEADAAEDTAADAAEETEETDAGDSEAAGDGEEIPVEEFLAMVKEPGEETLSSYTMTMDLEAEGQQIEAEGAVDISGESPAMQLTMSMPQMGEVEMITIDGEVYLAMPGATPEGMYIQDSGDSLGQAEAMEELDITSQWDAWEQGAEQVLFLGDEDVDGTELGHYQITVDPQAAAEAMGEDAAAITEAIGEESIVYDVWLDDDNLMRQLSFDLGGAVAEMSMDNWGEPQEITAPEADQIMDIGDMDSTEGSDG